MSATIGDGLSALALAGGIVGYLYVKHQSRQKKMEAIHQERMTAMERGIPLPEFPLEPGPSPEKAARDRQVIPLMGMCFSTLSIGAMVMLYLILPPESHSFWVAPLPLAFLGIGFVAFHFLEARSGR